MLERARKGQGLVGTVPNGLELGIANSASLAQSLVATKSAIGSITPLGGKWASGVFRLSRHPCRLGPATSLAGYREHHSSSTLKSTHGRLYRLISRRDGRDFDVELIEAGRHEPGPLNFSGRSSNRHRHGQYRRGSLRNQLRGRDCWGCRSEPGTVDFVDFAGHCGPRGGSGRTY